MSASTANMTGTRANASAAGRLSRGQRRLVTRIALTLSVALLVIGITRQPTLRSVLLQRPELASLDFRFRFRGPNPAIKDSAHVVIVDIDEDSFEDLPARFPWPRSYYAHLVRNLRAAGARAVGIDLIFSGGDSYAPANDSLFRDAISATHLVVLAGKREQDNPDFVIASSQQNFSNIFFDADSSLGLVNIRPDLDGVYRLYNPFYLIDTPGGRDTAVPTFAFAVLDKYAGLPALTAPTNAADHFTYRGEAIPKYDAASLLINYYGPDGTFPHVKFHDVVDDETFTTVDEAGTGEQINTFSDPEFGYLRSGIFKDRIVLVGVTVPEYKDLFPTSIARGKQIGDNLMYGVEIHANVIENVLRNDFLTKQSVLSEMVTILFLVTLTFFATSTLKGSKTRHHFMVELGGFLFSAGLLVLVTIGAVWLFTAFHYVFAITNAFLAVVSGYVASTTYHFVVERKQRLLIKSMFSTYVNPSVVDELVADPEKLVLGGKREELTVLFSDIEGFTTISQDLQPEGLVALLNEYLSAMSEIIFRNDGTLDKYEGDAIMAFWGAPIPRQDHAVKACIAAMQMRSAVKKFNGSAQDRGTPSLNTRIGINTGVMVVGNMGATGKFAYTVIGDSVNLASRLEGANKEYRTAIMVSQRTFDLVSHVIIGRELDRIAVKGRTEPVTTYELLQLKSDEEDPDLEEFLAHYARGKQQYYAMEWEPARKSFGEALRLRPEDYPTRLHLERIGAFALNPPGPAWDGVFVMKTK